MQRYQKVYLRELQKGDRFYFAGDKKKVVHTVEAFYSKLQKGYWKHYATCIQDQIPGKAKSKSEDHLQDRRVIFLRNINDK